jgi:Dual specificity phosphatase, catalytic domain
MGQNTLRQPHHHGASISPPPPPPPNPPHPPPGNNGNDESVRDDDCEINQHGRGSRTGSSSSSWWDGATKWTTLQLVLPAMAKKTFQASLTVTLVLYVLNQNHLLPRPISAVVSKALFWPTLPITLSRRIGVWMTPIDETVILGGIPFGFAGFPERLYHDYHVRAVINLCAEYDGPVKQYQRLGIQQLHLPTTDHYEPSVHDLEMAVDFIDRYQTIGQKVYVHCRAGHGRSAAVVYAWLLRRQVLLEQQQQESISLSPPPLLSLSPAPVVVAATVDLEGLNQHMVRLRNVRTGLWRQPNINIFHQRLVQKMNKNKKKRKPSESVEDNSFDDHEL